jgi:predicted transposase/invertase (TIGR01784 family)
LTHNIWTASFQIVSKYIYKPQILLQKLDEYGPLLRRLSQNPLGDKYNIVYYILTAIEQPDKIKVVDIFNKHTNKSEQIMGSFISSLREEMREEIAEEFIQAGINIGIDKGIAEKERQIAINLLDLGLKLDDISKATGLLVEELKKLKYNHLNNHLI